MLTTKLKGFDRISDSTVKKGQPIRWDRGDRDTVEMLWYGLTRSGQDTDGYFMTMPKSGKVRNGKHDGMRARA